MESEYQQEAPMDVYNSRMTARHARHAREIGEGDLSKGVRKSIEIAHKFMKVQQESNTIDPRALDWLAFALGFDRMKS